MGLSLSVVSPAAETTVPTPPSAARAEDFSARIALFDYDVKADLSVKTAGTELRGNVTVDDIEFTGAPGREAGRVKAFLVRPAGQGPFAAILWVHWLGDPATTNRTQFLDEAVALAREGVVSLLVDAMWSQPRWYRNRRFEQDRADSIRQVIALRRGLDLLLAQPGVEPARCVFVGHDYGAMHGTLLAGVESRVPAYVLIAGTPSLLDWAFFAAKPVSMEVYVGDMRALELTDYLPQARSRSFFLQYAEKDEYVPLPKALAYFAATPEAKQLVIYGGATHAMVEVPAIRIDRDAWLRRVLGLK